MPHKVEVGTVLLEDLPHALNALFERWPNATLTWARVKLAEQQRGDSFAAKARQRRFNKPWSQNLTPAEREEARLGGYGRAPEQEEF